MQKNKNGFQIERKIKRGKRVQRAEKPKSPFCDRVIQMSPNYNQVEKEFLELKKDGQYIMLPADDPEVDKYILRGFSAVRFWNAMVEDTKGALV